MVVDDEAPKTAQEKWELAKIDAALEAKENGTATYAPLCEIEKNSNSHRTGVGRALLLYSELISQQNDFGLPGRT